MRSHQKWPRKTEQEVEEERAEETAVLEETDELLDEIDTLLEDVSQLATYRQKGGE